MFPPTVYLLEHLFRFTPSLFEDNKVRLGSLAEDRIYGDDDGPAVFE